jgi:predicted unusual protein kinase regulating ubiquinone biosynthesis (AarF/ABC1/UbiB family)
VTIEGEDGPRFTKTGRFGRLIKMGGLAAQVAGAAVARGLGSAFKTEEQRGAAVRESLVQNAERVVRTMGEMKGAAMKLGQMLSISPVAKEFFPPEFLEELRALQKEAPPMSYDMLSREIEASLGRSVTEIFQYLDPNPIGAASIGQVHDARLFDGRRVAVKVRYPGIAETLESDLKNLGSILTMARVVADRERIDAYLEEARLGILEEADYRNEARNLTRYGAILREHPQVVVPEVVDELSTAEVLTMTFVEGEKLDVALDRIPVGPEKSRLGFDFSQVFVWMFHEKAILHADPHPGNFLLAPDGRFGFLDFGCFREYEPEFCDGWLDILVAKWKHEKERLPEIARALGFAPMLGSSGLSAQQLSDFNEIILAPFLYDRDFDWGTWAPKADVEAFVKGNLEFLRYAAPPKAIFYFRVAAGVWGLLARARVKGNWFRPAQDLARRRGRLR